MSELRESACIYCHKAIRTTVERDFCQECYVIQTPIRDELATTRRERDDYKQAWQRDLAKGQEFRWSGIAKSAETTKYANATMTIFQKATTSNALERLIRLYHAAHPLH